MIPKLTSSTASMVKGSLVNYSKHAFLGVLSIMLMMVHKGEATTFTVGGSKGWSVPSDNSQVYNQWAQNMRFQVGDSLLFVYPTTSDSLLRVTKEDYSNCTTTSPLEKYTDGHTQFKFNQSGPYYFISGNQGNCLKYEKITVVVLANRSNKTPSPAQSPPPSPPYAGGGETTPAPSAESHPPKNGGVLFVKGFVASLCALFGYFIFLAF